VLRDHTGSRRRRSDDHCNADGEYRHRLRKICKLGLREHLDLHTYVPS